jgi:hypothetical protein
LGVGAGLRYRLNRRRCSSSVVPAHAASMKQEPTEALSAGSSPADRAAGIPCLKAVGGCQHAVRPLDGILPAAVAAQRLMDRAALLSDFALDLALAGEGKSANTISGEAAKLRRQAEQLMEPWKGPNAE